MKPNNQGGWDQNVKLLESVFGELHASVFMNSLQTTTIFSVYFNFKQSINYFEHKSLSLHWLAGCLRQVSVRKLSQQKNINKSGKERESVSQGAFIVCRLEADKELDFALWHAVGEGKMAAD